MAHVRLGVEPPERCGQPSYSIGWTLENVRLHLLLLFPAYSYSKGYDKTALDLDL